VNVVGGAAQLYTIGGYLKRSWPLSRGTEENNGCCSGDGLSARRDLNLRYPEYLTGTEEK
jgi:hypothetical protein